MKSQGQEVGRWSIWIDIEGFSVLWCTSHLAVAGLRALMSGIYSLATHTYAGEGERLFAHQYGDGFVIVADFHEEDLERCAAIAVALMRHVALSGCLTRAAIAEGAFADVAGMWPDEIRQAIQTEGSSNLVRLGRGLMTLLPTMGTALIVANKLNDANPVRGSVLSIGTLASDRVPPSFPRKSSQGAPQFSTIDWVHAQSPILDHIASTSGVGAVDTATLESVVLAYVASHKLPKPWAEGTLNSNDLALGAPQRSMST